MFKYGFVYGGDYFGHQASGGMQGEQYERWLPGDDGNWGGKVGRFGMDFGEVGC